MPPLPPPCEPAATRPEMASAKVRAGKMQQSLLPPSALLDGLRQRHGLVIEGWMKPRDGVGGHIWNVHPLDEHTVAVMLADFCGHDLMAALHTFWLHAFSADRRESMRDPAQFLALLNRTLCDPPMAGACATLLLGLIDLKRNELRWSGAGLPAPLLALGRSCHALDGSGPPLGENERSGYVNRAVAFPPGARLLLRTGGLCEGAEGTQPRRHPVPDLPDAAGLEAILPLLLPEPLTGDATVLWISRLGEPAACPDDGRHLCLSGIDPNEAGDWIDLLALPRRPSPRPGQASRAVHLVASGQDRHLGGAFASRFAAIIELAPHHLRHPPSEELILPPGNHHLLASLTTATAYRLPLATLFCDALIAQDLADPTAKGDILLALQEAVANGVVHGNLEMHSPRRAFENMRAYWEEIRQRLADPALAERRITLAAWRDNHLLSITVTDQGRGFNPEAVQATDPSKPHGKGLRLINQLALGSQFGLGGRQHLLSFTSHPGKMA